MVEEDNLNDDILILNNDFIQDLLIFNQDALLLYMLYMVRAKLYKSSSIYATNNYCKRRLNWGEARLKNAKTFLRENNLITSNLIREKGRITGSTITPKQISDAINYSKLHMSDKIKPNISETSITKTKKSSKFKKLINTLINVPGVYFFTTEQDKILYIGSSTNLGQRLFSSFVEKFEGIASFKNKTRDLQIYCRCLICKSSLEALIIESIYIEKYKPTLNKVRKTSSKLGIKIDNLPATYTELVECKIL